MSANFDNLLLTEADGVAEVVINRDDIRNALAPEVRRDLLRCLETLRDSSAVRAIILTGAGKSFSAGGSIKHYKDQPNKSPAEVRADLDETVKLFQLVPRLDKPIIAAVNGHALGGGCGLAIACDITLASDRATFGFPEITRGFVPALVSVLCLQRVALKRTLEILLFGETQSAAAAVELGLANRVVPHDALLDTARAMARRAAGFGPDAVRTLKQLIASVALANYDSELFTAREVSTMMRFSTEFAAGAAAFLSRKTGG